MNEVISTKKIRLIVIIILVIAAASFVYLSLRYLLFFISGFEESIYSISYQDFIKRVEANSEFLASLNLIVTILFSYLVYSVSKELSQITKKEKLSKIKESSFNIYYGLVCNIEYLIDKINNDQTPYPINFEIREDFIKHIAILSNKLPDVFIHKLYDVFFKFSGMSNHASSDYYNMIALTIFSSTDKITKNNYIDYFQPDFLVLFSEIKNAIND